MNKHPLPLQLFQVLEEEYLSLHGDLTPKEEVTVNGRPGIVAMLDYEFHAGHVKAPGRLVKKLLAKQRKDTGKGHLPSHLRGAAPKLRQALDDYADPGKRAAADLEGGLDALLKVHIYEPDAFKYVNLQDATRTLVENYADAPAGSDALAYVNRLLLEEAFPDELEKVSDIRQAAMFKRLHGQKQSAICLSGGGIRSGTFALGLLQGLARFNLLKEFDYLSTVSGGGYIGGWLTAWLYRHPRGLDGVTEDLGRAAPKSKIDPDPAAVRHLREYSNFITPKAGLMTADTWAFIAIYLRNLLLNWMVLFPLVLAVLALPRLNVSLLYSQADWAGRAPAALAPLAAAFDLRHIFLGVGSLLLVLAIAYVSLSRPAVSAQLIERSKFWRPRRGQRSFLKWCLLPLVGAAFCLTTYWAWSSEASQGDAVSQFSGLNIFGVEITKKMWYVLFGIAIPVVSWLISSFFLERFQHPKEFTKLEVTVFILLVLVGAIGGWLMWWATLQEWSNPAVRDFVEAYAAGWPAEWYACLAVPVALVVLLLLTTVFVGLTSRGFFGGAELLNDEDREWWARFNAWVLIAAMAWAVFSILSIHGPRLFFAAPSWVASAGGISGLISLLAGYSAGTPAHDDQASKGGLLKAFFHQHLLPLLALVFLLVFFIAMSLLVTGLLYAAWPLNGQSMWGGANFLAMPFGRPTHMAVVHFARFWYVLVFILIAAGICTFLALRINLNKFSLHAGYRNRLIRAYLGASRLKAERRENPFTGFDPEDNVPMHELRPVLFHEGDFEDLEGLAGKIARAEDPTSKFLEEQLSAATRDELKDYDGATPLPQRLRINLITDLNQVLESEMFVVNTAGGADAPCLVKSAARGGAQQSDHVILGKRHALRAVYPAEIKKKYPPPHRLLHVINTSLNLVGGKNLAWQQRKAEPFAITPLHSGCFRVGYRRSRDYGGHQGISLGTAAAVSGAAASSNMGYYTTSPVISLVLTLFNVRLGWWLGNPGPAGIKTYYREAPRLSLSPVLHEAFGLTDDTHKYVYLTDGGHFENIALYEMVLRRCRVIVVSDAAQDGEFQFNDLGNAVRKIRIDLGVPIDFDEMPIYKKQPGDKKASYWAFGKIGYSQADPGAEDGVLIYVKPAVYGENEPRDVLQYKQANDDFPHQSTGDQFFDEPQLESYRMLGFYIMNRLCDNEFDTTTGVALPQRNLNIAEFIRAARQNYAQHTKGGEPVWLKELFVADKNYLVRDH
ncbi:MAG TPA: patatin-like phospholipase family protein [Pyrinomonadaceae bacterium]